MLLTLIESHNYVRQLQSKEGQKQLDLEQRRVFADSPYLAQLAVAFEIVSEMKQIHERPDIKMTGGLLLLLGKTAKRLSEEHR